jgi:hypothetical protein
MRRVWITGAGVGLVLLGLAVAAPGPWSAGQAVSVSAVMAGLRYHPQRWVGRTLVVYGRAVVSYCPPAASCPFMPQLLVDAGVPPQASAFQYPLAQSLPLAWSVDPRLEGPLHLPVVGVVLASWVHPHAQLGGVGTYHIRIRRQSAVYMGQTVQYQAVLLDGLW